MQFINVRTRAYTHARIDTRFKNGQENRNIPQTSFCAKRN